jgi:phosphatidylglycerophosphatase A
MEKIILTIASFFGVGYIRPLSATWGSLATALLLYPLWPNLALDTKIVITTTTFFLGWYICNQIKDQKSKDPHYIVIDETVGMMITTLLLTSNPLHWVLAFVLFRIFDIAKLWPASIFDKRPGGFNIMIDDVIMALVSLLALQSIITYFI